MFKLWRDINFIRVIVIVFIIVLIYFFFLSPLDVFVIAKLKFTDIFSKVSRLINPQKANLDKIVIVAIDDDSFREVNRKWPWERGIYAPVINKLKNYEPNVICYDFSLVGESSNQEDDLVLAQAIKNAGNVIVISYFDPQGKYTVPNEIFSDAIWAYGLVNKPRDKDYYIRRARAFYFAKGRKSILDYSFELKTICKYLNLDLNNISYDKNKGIIQIPKLNNKKDYFSFRVREDGTIPINYQAKFKEFQIVPFWKMLKEDFPQETFKDKIVLVSLTSEVFHDTHSSPLGIVSGVTVIANELLMFLNNNFIKEFPVWFDFLLLLIFSLFVAFGVYALDAVKGLIFSAIAVLVFIGFGLFFSLHNWWLDYFSVIFFTAMIYIGLGVYKYMRLVFESIRLKTLAITDSLTGVFVRRYLEVSLQKEFNQALRYNANLSVAMLDIDYFKNINDTYGHQAGDLVLKSIAEILLKLSRTADIVTRYGGEEFCIVLPYTSQESALVYTERIRQAVQDYNFPFGNLNITATVSIGLANLSKTNPRSSDELIKFADMALYEAKKSGRNKVCTFQPAA